MMSSQVMQRFPDQSTANSTRRACFIAIEANAKPDVLARVTNSFDLDSNAPLSANLRKVRLRVPSFFEESLAAMPKLYRL
jgi:hypothetical protein